MQISDVTGWRWRRRGWIITQNISGRCYVELAEIERFLARVKNGDFAKVATVPMVNGTTTKTSGIAANRKEASRER